MKIGSSQIRSLLGQLMPSLPERARNRIQTDKRSGLAYVLFDACFKAPRKFSAQTFAEREAVSLYFGALNAYGGEAEQCAKDHGLDLVYAGKIITPGFNFNDDPTCKAGIGRSPVASATEIELFCRMVKNEYENLEGRYRKVREAIEYLR